MTELDAVTKRLDAALAEIKRLSALVYGKPTGTEHRCAGPACSEH